MLLVSPSTTPAAAARGGGRARTCRAARRHRAATTHGRGGAGRGRPPAATGGGARKGKGQKRTRAQRSALPLARVASGCMLVSERREPRGARSRATPSLTDWPTAPLSRESAREPRWGRTRAAPRPPAGGGRGARAHGGSAAHARDLTHAGRGTRASTVPKQRPSGPSAPWMQEFSKRDIYSAPKRAENNRPKVGK